VFKDIDVNEDYINEY